MDIKGSQSTEEEVQGSNGHIKLTEDALKEALACPAGQASKPFIAALLKLANGLSFRGASQVSIELSFINWCISHRLGVSRWLHAVHMHDTCSDRHVREASGTQDVQRELVSRA